MASSPNQPNRDFTLALTPAWQRLDRILKAQGYKGSLEFNPCIFTNNTDGELIICGNGDSTNAPAGDSGRHIKTGKDFKYPYMDASQTWVKAVIAGNADFTAYPV